MAKIETLQAMVQPIVDSLEAEIYDIEFNGGVFKLTLDRPGGIDLESIAEATRQISRQIDLDDPIPGRFTLEVTSPGLERNLRLREHWATATGSRVRIKMNSRVDGDRRLEGVIVETAADTVTIEIDGTATVVAFDDIDKGRTVFEWGPQGKDGKKKLSAKKAHSSKKSTSAPKSGGASQTSEDSSAGDTQIRSGKPVDINESEIP